MFGKDLIALKVAPIHPLLRRSCALGYIRWWWSILAMGAQKAAVDCILNQDSPIPVPMSASAGRHFPFGRYRPRTVPDCLIRGRLGNESSIEMRPRSSHFIFAGIACLSLEEKHYFQVFPTYSQLSSILNTSARKKRY